MATRVEAHGARHDVATFVIAMWADSVLALAKGPRPWPSRPRLAVFDEHLTHIWDISQTIWEGSRLSIHYACLVGISAQSGLDIVSCTRTFPMERCIGSVCATLWAQLADLLPHVIGMFDSLEVMSGGRPGIPSSCRMSHRPLFQLAALQTDGHGPSFKLELRAVTWGTCHPPTHGCELSTHQISGRLLLIGEAPPQNDGHDAAGGGDNLLGEEQLDSLLTPLQEDEHDWEDHDLVLTITVHGESQRPLAQLAGPTASWGSQVPQWAVLPAGPLITRREHVLVDTPLSFLHQWICFTWGYASEDDFEVFDLSSRELHVLPVMHDRPFRRGCGLVVVPIAASCAQRAGALLACRTPVALDRIVAIPGRNLQALQPRVSMIVGRNRATGRWVERLVRLPPGANVMTTLRPLLQQVWGHPGARLLAPYAGTAYNLVFVSRHELAQHVAAYWMVTDGPSSLGGDGDDGDDDARLGPDDADDGSARQRSRSPLAGVAARPSA